jgi:hypothetical protein
VCSSLYGTACRHAHMCLISPCCNTRSLTAQYVERAVVINGAFNCCCAGVYPGCPPLDWDSECGGDRHVLVVDNATCSLYEAWQCRRPASLEGAAGSVAQQRELPCSQRWLAA